VKGKQYFFYHCKVIYENNALLGWEHIYAQVECMSEKFIFFFW